MDTKWGTKRRGCEERQSGSSSLVLRRHLVGDQHTEESGTGRQWGAWESQGQETQLHMGSRKEENGDCGLPGLGAGGMPT